VAIVAHEAGHFKLGHIWKMSLFSSVTSLAYFFLLQQLINLDSLYATFQTNSGIKGMGLVLSAIVFNKVLFFLSPFGTYFSRRNEYAADRFSVNTTHDAASMTSGLTRLVSDNLSTLQHHPLYTLLHDSHPPLPDRLKAIEELA
jgi:STE24 endopeptidase